MESSTKQNNKNSSWSDKRDLNTQRTNNKSVKEGFIHRNIAEKQGIKEYNSCKRTKENKMNKVDKQCSKTNEVGKCSYKEDRSVIIKKRSNKKSKRNKERKVETGFDELDEYLTTSKKEMKKVQRSKVLESLKAKYPVFKIPEGAEKAVFPELYVEMKNDPLLSRYSVPSYWKQKTPSNIYSEEYVLPPGIHECGLMESRTRAYKRNIKYIKPKIYKSKIDIAELEKSYLSYKINFNLENTYDGTEKYFIKGCRKGFISDKLQEALGRDSEFLKLIVKKKDDEQQEEE
ncbi:hypothetical protein ENBRE01_0293 [Enteropsectra breve]|nr:hypothetical protein ENBRE01_0293 [Enteropsectra breve]